MRGQGRARLAAPGTWRVILKVLHPWDNTADMAGVVPRGSPLHVTQGAPVSNGLAEVAVSPPMTAMLQKYMQSCAGCGRRRGDSGVKLSRCSGCSAVRYCSRECQVRCEHRVSLFLQCLAVSHNVPQRGCVAAGFLAWAYSVRVATRHSCCSLVGLAHSRKRCSRLLRAHAFTSLQLEHWNAGHASQCRRG